MIAQGMVMTRQLPMANGLEQGQRSQDESTPLQVELVERVRWLVTLRWLAIAGIVAATTSATLLAIQLPVASILGVATAIAAYNLLFHFYSGTLQKCSAGTARLARLYPVVHSQISLDLLALALVLHLSGGVENPFAFFFVFHVILASILISRLAAYVYAVLAIALFGGVVMLEFYGLVPHVHLTGVSEPDLYSGSLYVAVFLAVFACTLILTAYLASSISNRLRERTETLLQVNRELARTKAEFEHQTETLTETKKRLEKAVRARAVYTLQVAHQLRGRLAAIQNSLDLVTQGYVKPDDCAGTIEIARNSTAELLAVVNDLLLLGRLRETAQLEKACPVDLPDVVRQVANLLRSEVMFKQINLEVSIEDGLPPVYANRDHLQHMLSNLLDNAIKYTPAGGRICISLWREGDFVVGDVMDTGIGIPARDLPRVFDEFYRAEQAKAMVPSGTGLGLPIVKHIVDLYGGRLDLYSTVGSGTRFTFAFPAIAGESDADSSTNEGGDLHGLESVQSDARYARPQFRWNGRT